jgi:type III secretory pathway component EscV
MPTPLKDALTPDDVSEKDVNLEDEDLDTGVEDEDAEDADESDEDEVDEEDEDGDDLSKEKDNTKTEKPLFNKKQQAEVNRLVQNRLAQQEAKFYRELSTAAGIEIPKAEVSSATRLWGLLKANPDLSTQINDEIMKALKEGKAKAPDALNSPAAKRLELKEATLDLKAEDLRSPSTLTRSWRGRKKRGTKSTAPRS